MTPQELALQSWREDKVNYQRSARRTIADLCDSSQGIPSAAFQAKTEELREYLRYNYTYDEEENFTEVYVQFISGRKNMSVMELSHKLVEEIGGTIKFWQTKITDIATYVHYHPELSMWEANSYYQKFLGLSPEALHNQRKKRGLAKKYLNHLAGICKLIDKSKPFEEDLLKIDDFYVKLKKTEEDYYAFIEEVENRRANEAENVSSKGITIAKKNMFLFFKPKEPKMNTLMNYNFKCRTTTDSKPSNLLKGSDYEELNGIFDKLKSERRSQRINMCTRQSAKENSLHLQQLRAQFVENHKPKPPSQLPFEPHPIFIWSKEYCFSYWGFLIKSTDKFSYTSPFEKYPNVNYEIDSQQEFNQFYAEDLEDNESDQSMSADQNQNSFVVSDDHDSDKEDEMRMKIMSENYFKDRWVKLEQDLRQYQLICLDGSLPLPMTQECAFTEDFINKINGMTKADIITLLDQEKVVYSKAKLDQVLRSKFDKKRTKNKKKIVYQKKTESQEGASELDTTSQVYEISVSHAFRPNMSEIAANQETTVDDQDIKSDRST